LISDALSSPTATDPRSNGRRASAAASHSVSFSRRGSGRPWRSITGRSTPTAAPITCTGSPATAWNVVRSASCRRTTSESAAASTGTSTRPVISTTDAML